MTIDWYGQSCFRIDAKEGSILIDPFSNETGLRRPKIKDDLVLVTHPHYDHKSVEDMNPEALLIDSQGEFERKGISVTGILSYHDKAQGAQRGLNTIFVIKAEDMTICHLGDIGQAELSDEQIEAIGDVDILMVPVGGNYTTDSKEASNIVSEIEPKVIIPMHYKLPGLKMDLQGPEKFIKEIGLTPEKVDKYRIQKKLLPVEETKLVLFQWA